MSDYRVINPQAGFPAITAVDSTPQIPVGFEVDARDFQAASNAPAFGKFVYCQGSNVASAGQFVQIQNGSALLLAAANSGSNFPVGVAAAALTGTNQFGFVQVQGRVDYAKHTNTGITGGVPQYICAGTPGLAVSNAVAGNKLQGVYVPADQTNTATSVAYTYDLNRPFIAGVTAGL